MILLRYVSVGTVLIAFALGMLVASLFPYTIAVIIIAAVLILAGLRLCRLRVIIGYSAKEERRNENCSCSQSESFQRHSEAHFRD